MSKLTIVVRCYKKSEVLPQTVSHLLSILEDLISKHKASVDSTPCFIDDGSSDNTQALLKEFSIQHPSIHGVKISRTQGHQNAMLAGMLHVDCDSVISVDTDLQDAFGAIEGMLDKFLSAHDIVYSVREGGTLNRHYLRAVHSKILLSPTESYGSRNCL